MGWDKKAIDTLSLLTFRAEETWYASPAAEIARISPGTGPSSEPSAGDEALSPLLGYTGKQGGIGLFITADPKGTGFMVDEIGTVKSFSSRSLRPLPDFLVGRCHRALWGIGIEEDRLYFLLNLSDAVEE